MGDATKIRNLNEHLSRRRQAAYHGLAQKGGWRTLLDIFAAEWGDTDMAEKVVYLTAFLQVVELHEITDAYIAYHQGHRDDIVRAVPATMKAYEDFGYLPAKEWRRQQLRDRIQRPDLKRKKRR